MGPIDLSVRCFDVVSQTRINQLISIMRYAMDLPNFGDYGDPRLLAGLAREVETHGWNGFFIWDHILAPGAMPVADTTVTLAAIALETLTGQAE